jgi:hypothetical protein
VNRRAGGAGWGCADNVEHSNIGQGNITHLVNPDI